MGPIMFVIQLGRQLFYSVPHRLLIMLQVESRISSRVVTAKGKKYAQLYIYLPKDLVKDSAFPFKSDDKVLVHIQNRRLVIEKMAD